MAFAVLVFFVLARPPSETFSPYTTLFRSRMAAYATALLRVLCKRKPSPPRMAIKKTPPKQSVSQNVLRSEEHTSELQSRGHLVCRPLLENKNETSMAAEITAVKKELDMTI